MKKYRMYKGINNLGEEWVLSIHNGMRLTPEEVAQKERRKRVYNRAGDIAKQRTHDGLPDNFRLCLYQAKRAECPEFRQNFSQ